MSHLGLLIGPHRASPEEAGDVHRHQGARSRSDQLVLVTCLLTPTVAMSRRDNLIVFAHRD